VASARHVRRHLAADYSEAQLERWLAAVSALLFQGISRA